jgi:hypothetical protein
VNIADQHRAHANGLIPFPAYIGHGKNGVEQIQVKMVAGLNKYLQRLQAMKVSHRRTGGG